MAESGFEPRSVELQAEVHAHLRQGAGLGTCCPAGVSTASVRDLTPVGLRSAEGCLRLS